jgi:hypothetical protein
LLGRSECRVEVPTKLRAGAAGRKSWFDMRRPYSCSARLSAAPVSATYLGRAGAADARERQAWRHAVGSLRSLALLLIQGHLPPTRSNRARYRLTSRMGETFGVNAPWPRTGEHEVKEHKAIEDRQIAAVLDRINRTR